MGIPSCLALDARNRDGARGTADRRQTTPVAVRRILAACLICFLPLSIAAETLRIATWSAPLSRTGPGLLLADILKGEDPALRAIYGSIDTLDADVLVLTDFDYDLNLVALSEFNARLADPYPIVFANAPNSGVPTGLDLDGNGATGEPRDAQGYGRFAGDGGIAILSRYPVVFKYDLSDHMWRDIGGQSTDPEPVAMVQKLSSTAHWVLEIQSPDKPFDLMVFAATTPLYDGPDDRNGRRNADEIGIWTDVIDGRFGPIADDFVIAGLANLDPDRGEGLRDTIKRLLRDPRLTDPHSGLPTYADPPLRMSYVLPSANWTVLDGSVIPPPVDAGKHAIVWIDLARQGP